MAFVPEVPYEKADPTLRDSYDKILEVPGFLPHFWQAQGTQPETVRASLGLWAQIYRSGVLPSTLKEEIVLVVSAANSNSYCIIAHLELLKRLGIDKAVGRQIARDFEAADVPERDKALFRFAKKLTTSPFEVKEPDIAELRRHGWDDAAILETSLVASHSNFLNRLAAALGLIPEDVF